MWAKYLKFVIVWKKKTISTFSLVYALLKSLLLVRFPPVGRNECSIFALLWIRLLSGLIGNKSMSSQHCVIWASKKEKSLHLWCMDTSLAMSLNKYLKAPYLLLQLSSEEKSMYLQNVLLPEVPFKNKRHNLHNIPYTIIS